MSRQFHHADYRALLYPLAGVYRLVRHNLQRQCEYFTGLPITIAGFLLALPYLSEVLFTASSARPTVFPCLTTALAALMVVRSV